MRRAQLQQLWARVRGQDCQTCRFAQVFRSNGDGQVTRLHAFCRNPASEFHNRPLPARRWCPAWQQDPGGRKPQPEELEGLTP